MSYDFPDNWDYDAWYWGEQLKVLGENFAEIAALKLYGSAMYAKGFGDGTLLREFCDDYVPEAYFPMGDNRPTAERLRWENAESIS